MGTRYDIRGLPQQDGSFVLSVKDIHNLNSNFVQLSQEVFGSSNFSKSIDDKIQNITVRITRQEEIVGAITGDTTLTPVIQICEGGIYNIGVGQEFVSVSGVLGTILKGKRYLTNPLTLNIHGTHNEDFVLDGFTGNGFIEIKFMTGAILNGNIRSLYNTVPISIIGQNETTYTRINGTIENKGSARVQAKHLNLKSTGTDAIKSIDGGIIEVALCDILTTQYGFTSENGSTIICRDVRGNTNNTFRALNGGEIKVTGIRPLHSVENLVKIGGFFVDDGGATSPSTITP